MENNLLKENLWRKTWRANVGRAQQQTRQGIFIIFAFAQLCSLSRTAAPHLFLFTNKVRRTIKKKEKHLYVKLVRVLSDLATHSFTSFCLHCFSSPGASWLVSSCVLSSCISLVASGAGLTYHHSRHSVKGFLLNTSVFLATGLLEMWAQSFCKHPGIL